MGVPKKTSEKSSKELLNLHRTFPHCGLWSFTSPRRYHFTYFSIWVLTSVNQRAKAQNYCGLTESSAGLAVAQESFP